MDENLVLTSFTKRIDLLILLTYLTSPLQAFF